MATTAAEGARPEGVCTVSEHGSRARRVRDAVLGDGFGMAVSPAELTPEFLTVQQVAEYLTVSSRTVHRLVVTGQLARPIKIGSSARFLTEDVRAYVEARKEARHKKSAHGGLSK